MLHGKSGSNYTGFIAFIYRKDILIKRLMYELCSTFIKIRRY